MAGVKGRSGRKVTTGTGEAIWIPREMVAEVRQMVDQHKAGISRLSTKEKIETAIAEVTKRIPPRERAYASKIIRKFLAELEPQSNSEV